MEHSTIPSPRPAAAGHLAAVLTLAFATQVLLAEEVHEEGKRGAAPSQTSGREAHPRGTIPCPDCRASGRETCPECGGAGKHMKVCPRCSGTAQRPCPVCNDPADEDETSPGAVVCTACSGRGTLGNGVRRCSKCGGSGTYRCLTCFGDGLLRCRPEVLDHHCRRCRRVGKIECRTCGGKRRISKEAATRRDRAGRATEVEASIAGGLRASNTKDEASTSASSASASSASRGQPEEPSRPPEDRFTALVDLLETVEARLREDPRRQLLDVHSAASDLERRLEASAHPEVKELAEEATAVRRRAGSLHSRWGSMLEVRDVFERTVKKCDMVWQRKDTLSPKDPLEAHQSWEEDMRLALRIAERVARRLEDLGLPSLDEEIETMNGKIVEIGERSRDVVRTAMARASEAEESRDEPSGGRRSADGRHDPDSSLRSREDPSARSGGISGESDSGEALPVTLRAEAPAGRTAEPEAGVAGGSDAKEPGTAFPERPEKKGRRAGTRREEAAAASPGFLAGVLWGAGACALAALVFRFLVGARVERG